MTNPKDAQKTLRYEQSMKQQGYVRIHPWVWPADREAVLEYARKLRDRPYGTEVKTPLT